MPLPSEHKTVQARILTYAQAIGWTFVPHEQAEQRRRGTPASPPSPPLSLFFDDLLDAKVREFNPRYTEAEDTLLGQLRHFHTNREFVEHPDQLQQQSGMNLPQPQNAIAACFRERLCLTN